MKPLSPVCWCHTLLIVPLLAYIKAAAVAAAATATESILPTKQNKSDTGNYVYSAQLDAILLSETTTYVC